MSFYKTYQIGLQKYGTEIWWINNSLVSCAINRAVYWRRQPGESMQQNFGEITALKLSFAIRKTGRLSVKIRKLNLQFTINNDKLT